MIKNSRLLYGLLWTVSALCLCTQLPPDDLQMINFGNNNGNPLAPSITMPPQSQTVTAGQSVTFSVTATGTAPLSYQWFVGGNAISGATSSSYSISNVQTTNAGTYTVTVSNGTLPNAKSSGAVLTVSAVSVAPSITTPPQSQTITAGQSVTFSVTAIGTAPLSYQWYIGGNAISGATSSSYSLSNVQAVNAGTFTVTVSNGTLPNATSSGAVLTVSATSVTVTDIDGNVYHTVTIGTQVWMVENLKTTKYNDSSSILLVTDNTAWKNNRATGGYCWYNDSITYRNTFGALYNWYAVNTGKLAPIGWHVPTDSEWTILISYLGGVSVAGGPLKEAGTSYWRFPNVGANNASGFSALPGGYRDEGSGNFLSIDTNGYWWSSTLYDYGITPFYCIMDYDDAFANLTFPDGMGMDFGYSVRCVKN